MKKKQLPKTIKAFMLALTFFCYAANAQSQTEASVDSLILKSLSDHHIPGLSAAIIKNGKVAWAKGYGYANIEKNIPFTKNTIHAEIASLSKIITATALLQLWEQGLFKLDDPINDYLPFTIKNPYYPNVPITFRMLLHHTSSITESFDLALYNFDFNNTPTQPLDSFLFNILNPAGKLYVDSLHFNNYAPGTQWSYSNFAYAVIGYLVEHISGTPFNKYCDKHIFKPLCMNNTGWFFSDVDTNVISRPYSYNFNTATHVPYKLYEYPDYPDGQLKASVLDLSKFMLMHMNNGTLNGVKILNSSTVSMMRSDLVQTIWGPILDGLGIFFVPDYCGSDYWAHNGGDLGIVTDINFDLAKSTGIIIFTNGEEGQSGWTCDNDDLLHTLASFAATIPTADKPALNCDYISTPCEHGTVYWKKNAAKWALSSVPMKLGTQHYYTKQQVLALLNTPITDDASIILAKQLIAAKLNAAQGSELSPIISTINAANDLIGTSQLPVQPKIPLTSVTGIKMLALATKLNLYNYRFLNSNKCSGNDGEESEVNEMDAEIAASRGIAVFPNPLAHSTTVSFTLAQSQNVSLSVFDISGKLIKVLADGNLAAGEHTLEWNAEKIDAGVYFVQFQSEQFVKTEKLIVTH